MIGNSDINDLEKDEIWYSLIDVLFSEETDDDGENIVDIDEIAYASFYLSINFYALNEKIRNTLIERLNQINNSQMFRFFEVIDYLFEGDRESEILPLLHLLQSTQSVSMRAAHILEEGNLTPSWKNIAALVSGRMYEDDISDMVSAEENIHALQQENVKWEKPEGIDDEDIPF